MAIIEYELKKLQKKLDLLVKKNKTFGLNEEEHMKYKDMRIKFLTTHDEYVDSEFDRVFMTYLHDNETIMALEIIQSILPWNGGLVLKDIEFESILNAELDLKDSDRKKIKNNLIKLHDGIFINLKKLYADKDLQDFAMDVSRFVTKDPSATIESLVGYIDDRYREFGEILGIELDEIDWD